MNAIAEPCAPVSKRSTSPRPPAVGEEVKKFHDTSQPYKNWNMEYQSKPSCGEHVERSVTPACSHRVNESSDCKEISPNSSPPPPYKWAQNLLCLLDDAQGVSLFQQFLQQEGQDTRCLAFWFACRGVKKCDPDDRDGLIKLINVLFEKKVKRISAISAETKEEIKHKLSSDNDVDDTIFDAAQREVEEHMMKTTYPNFLRSDLYIQHLRKLQNEYSTEKECTISPEPVDLLPTVHEDSELQIPCKNIIPLTKTNLLQRRKISSAPKLKQESPAGYLQSPYSNYHSKYSSFLPASAQDSELQSLSSDAQTDDSMSLADSNLDYPTYSRSKQKRQNKLLKHSAILNKDELSSQPAFIPRTQRLPPESLPKDGNSKEFLPMVVRKLNKILDDARVKERIFEKLKIIESTECSKPDVVTKSTNKSTADTVDYPVSEEDAQNIIDEHVSRVFDSGQQTPAMSSGCLSPLVARPSGDVPKKSRVPSRGISCEPPQEFSLGASHKHSASQSTVPNIFKHRRDHDTHSTDSAMFDYVSDDNRTSSYRSQQSSMDSELVDFSQRSREHSRRHGDKKFSSMTDSYSSFVDSGISSVACESVPGHVKVTSWLEGGKEKNPERHQWRNMSTSPVLSRHSSDRKATTYVTARNIGQEVGYSQWSAIASQIIAHDSSSTAFPPPDTTSNLIGARRRLEDERAKLKAKCVSGSRNSHDPSRMKYPKGYDSYEDGICQRKQSRRSCPSGAFDTTPVSSTSSELTVIGYSYGRRSVPYLSKMPGKNITLRQFKSLLSKKGNFKYFFKTASDELGTGVVFEEVADDSSVLPMWEGKVFCVIEPMDDNTAM